MTLVQPSSTERLFVALPGDAGPGPETQPGTDCIRALAIPSALGGVVGQALIYRETFPAGEPMVERVLPDGALRIGIDLSGTNPAPLVLGPRSRPDSVPLRGRMEGLSLTIRQAAARAMLGIPVGDVTGNDVPLAELWGPVAQEFGGRLAEAGDDEARAAVLWDSLRLRMAGAAAEPLPWLVASQVACGQEAQIVRQGLGVSERRVQQLFREHVGLSPRSVARLSRWHRLLRRLRGVERPNWAGLAVGHGWYDQAHLIRDFRAFSGLTPTEYFSRAISGSSKNGQPASG